MYSSGSVSGTISGVNLTFVGNGTVNINKLTGDLTATVVDDKGNAISGGYVSFYLNGTYIGRADVVNGVATLNYIGFKKEKINSLIIKIIKILFLDTFFKLLKVL